MRRQLVCAAFAVWMSAFAAPAFATGIGNASAPEPDAVTPVAVQRVSVPAAGVRDEAAMVLVGTALIGLAAAVRRAV